ncbi:hypothetical protein [Halovenus sp. HT40]|uniref:hypothetical protein n=1 Tax=Halovenus sp. HT40 TaxID=3126691 RepID=UPI00300E9A3E
MDLEENRNLQKSQLYKNERKLLAGPPHETDLDQQTKNRARRNIINTRLPNLPQRIQALVDDVALLCAGGYLNSEHWSEGWDEILDIQPRMQLERDSEFVDPHTWMPNTQLDDEVRLGYTVGQMLRSLGSVAGADVDYDDLGWGFILGIFGESRSGFDREYQKTSDFLNNMTERLSQKKSRQQSPEMNETVEMESIEEDLGRYRSGRPLEYNNPIDKRVRRVRQDIAEVNAIADRDIAEVNAIANRLEYADVLDSVLTASPDTLKKAGKLTSQVQRHTSLIHDSRSGNLSAEDVFREVWKKNNYSVDRDSIKQACNTSKKQVTEIMNNLGSNPTSEKWKNEPPLVKEGGGRVNPEWSLTDLGYVIGFSMFEDRGIEFVHRAIAQVITDQQGQHEIHDRISGSMSELE